MKNYKAKGIVLHTVKYGESGLVVFLLTDLHGRRSYMVQGIRSRNTNRGALFQPMFPLEFEGVVPTRGEMHRFGEIRPARAMASIPFDPRKNTITLFMAEVLYRMIREVEPESPLFDFVWEAVAALDGMERGVSNFHLWFLVRLSYHMGLYPGNDYTPGAWFDFTEGLFTPVRPPHRLVFSQDNALLLHRLMGCGTDDLDTLPLGRGQRGEFLEGLVNYLGYHLDSVERIESLRILREVF